MKTLRTPDDRFADLPDYPFTPHYVDIDDQDGGTLRVHYLDEGPADGPVVLLMHGEPSWSYLYRKMIPLLTDAGLRVIAPDLVGFGKSDKPAEKSDYTYARHVAWMQEAIVDHLDLRDATFFGQDWGGLVGLRLVAANPDRFARVVIGNTGLPNGQGDTERRVHGVAEVQPGVAGVPDRSASAGCDEHRTDRGRGRGVRRAVSRRDVQGGRSHLPVPRTHVSRRPAVPDNLAAWKVFMQWTKPFVCCFSDDDPVTAGGDKPFLKLIPERGPTAHDRRECTPLLPGRRCTADRRHHHRRGHVRLNPGDGTQHE